MSAPDVQLPRDPRAFARGLAIRVLVVAGALAVGLALQHVVSGRLAEIQALAEHDVIRARAELAHVLRIVAVAVFGMTGAVGVAMLVAGRRALREDRFPPAGAFSWGAQRVLTGDPARRMARFSMALSVLLVVCSVAGAALTWHMASVLLACRAGVAT
jgi:hypothetical protein